MGYNCMEPHVPPSWRDCVEALEPCRTVAVLGATDVGKSTFCQWLVQTLTRRGPVGLVDCDVGQTTLGPPTTIAGKVFDARPTRWADLRPPVMRFVGSTSPQGHLLQTVAAAKYVCDRLRSLSPLHIVVDTTGLVTGGLGRALKLNKLEVIQADAAVLIERERELEGLAWALASTTVQVLRVPASPAAAGRSSDVRGSRRRDQFQAYFADAEPLTLDLAEVLIRGSSIGRGQPLDAAAQAEMRSALGGSVSYAEACGPAASVALSPRRGRISPNALAEAKRRLGLAEICAFDVGLLRQALVALEDESAECLGLGIVEESDFAQHTVRVRTPVAPPRQVRTLSIGSLRLANDGTELSGDPRPVCV